MSNEFFDVDRRHEVDPQRLRRIVESWAMSPIDFDDGCMSWYGANRDDEGAWPMPNGLIVGFRPFRGKSGWSRWQLPGMDGITRSRLVDRGAPWVARSPNGVFFLCSASAMRRMTFAQLLYEIGSRTDWIRLRSRNSAMCVAGGAAA